MNRPPSISGSTSSGSDQYASAHSDDDDYEVDMDSLTSDTPRAAPVMAPMIPTDCTNPLEALNSFTHQFANRYSSVSLLMSSVMSYVTSCVIGIVTVNLMSLLVSLLMSPAVSLLMSPVVSLLMSPVVSLLVSPIE